MGFSAGCNPGVAQLNAAGLFVTAAGVVEPPVAPIKEWASQEIFAVNVTLDVMEAVERDGQTIATVTIDGTFDRTGLPDPLLMDHCFTVAGDKIAALNCRLAVQADAQGAKQPDEAH